MDPTLLTLAEFPVHAPCEAVDEWPLTLFRALGSKLEIDPRFEPSRGFGCGYARQNRLEGIAGQLTGGIRVLGTKKRAAGDAILVDYALFAPDGAAIAWANSLSPSRLPVIELFFAIPGKTNLPLGDPQKAMLKAMTKAAKAMEKAKAGA